MRTRDRISRRTHLPAAACDQPERGLRFGAWGSAEIYLNGNGLATTASRLNMTRNTGSKSPGGKPARQTSHARPLGSTRSLLPQGAARLFQDRPGPRRSGPPAR
jgi:hypothetical protein